MSGSLILNGQQFFDDNGNPLSNGKVYTYISGTSTLKATYEDRELTILNTNPVILDAAGRCKMFGTGVLRVVVKDANDVLLTDTSGITTNATDATITGGFSVAGNTSLTGNLGVTGDTTLTGGLVVDHTTEVSAPYPVLITHSNVWLNTDTYGSNTVEISSTGLNNNQPLLLLKKDVNTANYGNSANLILQNSGTRVSTDIFAVDLEMVACNTSIDTVNGKFELGTISAYGAGAGEAGGGLFYIAPRRKTATGFERMVDFFQLSRGGRIYHRGEGISITPLYNPADTTNVSYSNNRAFLDISTAFTDAEINVVSTLAAGNAQLNVESGSSSSAQFLLTGGSGSNTKIEVDGGASTYIRAQSSAGTCYNYTQANASNANAVVEIRSNWTSAGTGSAILNFYTDAVLDGYRLNANGGNGRLNFHRIDGGTVYEMVDFNDNNAGRVTFFNITDYSKGAIRLGDSSGAEAGGTIAYDSNTGVYAITGNYATFNGLRMARMLTSAPASSSSPGEPGDFYANDSYLYVYCTTGWRRIAAGAAF